MKTKHKTIACPKIDDGDVFDDLRRVVCMYESSDVCVNGWIGSFHCLTQYMSKTSG